MSQKEPFLAQKRALPAVVGLLTELIVGTAVLILLVPLPLHPAPLRLRAGSFGLICCKMGQKGVKLGKMGGRGEKEGGEKERGGGNGVKEGRKEGRGGRNVKIWGWRPPHCPNKLLYSG